MLTHLVTFGPACLLFLLWVFGAAHIDRQAKPCRRQCARLTVHGRFACNPFFLPTCTPGVLGGTCAQGVFCARIIILHSLACLASCGLPGFMVAFAQLLPHAKSMALVCVKSKRFLPHLALWPPHRPGPCYHLHSKHAGAAASPIASPALGGGAQKAGCVQHRRADGNPIRQQQQFGQRKQKGVAGVTGLPEERRGWCAWLQWLHMELGMSAGNSRQPCFSARQQSTIQWSTSTPHSAAIASVA